MPGEEPVPTAVTRLLSARYPTLEVDPSWLTSCVARLRKRDASLRTGSPDQLARAVRQEMLDSDLADVTPASYSRINAERLRTFVDKVGDVGRGAVLVQIESVMDVGYSASSQLEIAEARRDARRANVDPNDVPADAKVDNAEADHMADFQAQEDDKIQASTVFPRRMLKFELSDGSKGAPVFAVELQRISSLDMNTTSIGTKLLLKGALIKDGYLLLMPQTVSVEGGCVRKKDRAAEDKLIDKLRLQLGIPPQSDSSANGQQASASTGSTARPSERAAKAAVERGFSPDDDESELLAALEAEEARAATTSSSTRPSVVTGARNTPAPIKDLGPASVQPPVPTRQRAILIVPESLTQTGKARSQNTALKASVTQEDPISLIDSDDDDDALFASVPDTLLEGAEMAIESRSFGRQRERSRQEQPASTRSYHNSREEPIVIESSPEL
ncbi:uncharacterized protein SPSC_05937 [Sporisorium scitamineum]|uniref:RecQ-mediated genome instability protein 1 n=1 Tax=Sporisorium scitamineum TaxID=49012 RepID=A0A0F7S4A4_9BASI|nr:hypothetical protein [Sporisorium scitamineum]CDU25766.1 uncharacterized protein SPSC_05937 [Sporisorium scitamineum]